MKKLFVFIVLSAGFVTCREAYNPPLTSPDTGYLVVEGFINSNGGASTITLSRTTKLQDAVSVLYEHNAQVQIESDGNEIHPLYEGANGTYTSEPLLLSDAAKYRVRIFTSEGKEYLSSYVSTKKTPSIDSISWEQTEDGVTTHIHTHDATGEIKYYRWNYEETWQIRSAYYSTLKYEFDSTQNYPVKVVFRYPLTAGADTTIWDCWQSNKPTNILLGTTEKLSSNVIYLPLSHIEQNSIKLGVMYSVELKQYALSQDAYHFYERLKKNTEELGSIFDAQPSDLQGNIRCETNPAEIVIGYIDVTSEESKRIFIKKDQVHDWKYVQGCTAITIDNKRDSIQKYGTGLIPTVPVKLGPFNAILTFSAADPYCVDCTLRGTNQKPSFWP